MKRSCLSDRLTIRPSYYLAILLSGYLAILPSCGSSSTTPAVEEEADTATITGTLGTGVITNLGAKSIAKADEPASGYTVVAINNSSNKTYRATTDSDGAFSLDVPTGSTYLVSLINSGSYEGPIVFSGTGNEVTTGIAPVVDTNLGEITLDETNGYARPATDATATDAAATAVASSSVPAGAGHCGKIQQTGITNRSDSDKDKDGIPNIFDCDEDNDNVRNGIASTPSSATVVSDYIETVYMSSNIWKEHGSATTGSTQAEIAANEMALRLHVEAVEGYEDHIASVQCIDVPAAIASVATIRWAESLGEPDGYPTEHSLWSDADYNLYKTTDTEQFPDEQWIVSIKPVGVMNAGDTFTIRVTYTDSTYEDFFIIMPYVMTDWAKIQTYDGTELTSDVGKKTDGAQATATDDLLTIVFAKPLDEDGNVLEGITYAVTYGESDCTGEACSVPGGEMPDPITVEDTDPTSLTLTADVPTPDVGTTYYITPVARMGGQGNGEETWFTRE